MKDGNEAARLVHEALAHDEGACQKLLNLYKGRIFSYIYRMVHNYHDAEDLTFDTFIRCFNALENFDASKSFSTWLFTIAHNLTMDHFRRNKQEFEYLDEQQASKEDLAGQYEKKRKLEKIDQALAELAPVDRELVILFHKEEHSYQEISEILNIPVTTIKTRLHRARIKLQAIVHEQPKST